MKIAIMGAGGIGGYVGGRLAQAGETVHFLARGKHLEAMKRDGLCIESAHGDLTLGRVSAHGDPSEIGPVDLVLFTVKLGDTDAAARSLAPLVAQHTRVATLQNGIDSKDIIGRYLDPGHVAAGIIYLAAYIKSPGVITNPGGVHCLTIDRMDGDPVMVQFFAACDRAVGLEAVPTDDPVHTLWDKFIALVAFSGVTAITRLPIGAVYEHPEALAFMRALLDENILVAQARGLKFDQVHVDSTVELFRKQPYGQKSSMLVDLEAGKPIELPWLSGRVHAFGRELGIDTPANSAIWAALSPYVGGAPRVQPR